MTAYLIKPEGLVYLENVEATFKPYGGKWLALDAQVEVLEGEWPGSVVLMEFPDMESAKKWYSSPEYQKILSLRTDNVISDLILVDPVGPGFTSAGWAQQIRSAIAAGNTPSADPTGQAPSKYSITPAELEASVRVPVEDQVAEQPEPPAEAPLTPDEVDRQIMLRNAGL
jgi:uncharacterized protein (DUF1330 family)